MPRSIFVSPHFDDVALSCGGTVARAARGEGALVVTVFAGEAIGQLNPFAEFQHRRWGTDSDVVEERRREDALAMARLGATYRWLDYPDAIYRENLYLSDEDLFGEVKSEDMATAMAVVDTLVTLVGTIHPVRIYLPLAVGGHVDHRICRMAARPLLDVGGDVYLYEDFPYVISPNALDDCLAALDGAVIPEVVDVTADLAIRLSAIEAYPSQLATIFRNYGPYRDVVTAYARKVGDDRAAFAERVWRVIKSPGIPFAVSTL